MDRKGFIAVFETELGRKEISECVASWLERFEKVEQVVPRMEGTLEVKEPSEIMWEPNLQFRVTNGQQFAFRAEADSKCNYAALGFKFQTGNFPCIYSRNLFTANIDGTHLNKVTPTPDFDSGELFWIQ